MASVNKAIIIGNLGKDPEMRYIASGDAVCNITVATSETWKDKATGEKKEATEWHRVSFFGRLAEVAGEYLAKGSAVYVEGSIHTRKWTDKDGQDRYTTEIHGNEMRMLGGRPDPGRRQEERSPPADNRAPAQNKPAPRAFDDLGDDIPFIFNVCSVSDMMGLPKSMRRARRGESVHSLFDKQAYF